MGNMNRREFIKQSVYLGCALGVPGIASPGQAEHGPLCDAFDWLDAYRHAIISKYEMESLGLPTIRTACNQAFSTMGELCNERESP